MDQDRNVAVLSFGVGALGVAEGREPQDQLSWAMGSIPRRAHLIYILGFVENLALLDFYTWFT